MNKKTLFNTEKFDVIEKEGKVGIEPHSLIVSVLPFNRDNKGLPTQLGILKEYNRIWSKETIAAITGIAQGEDPDILSAAMRRLRNVSGFDVQEPERWFFLGFVTTHKSVNQEIPCFACDLTGLNLPESVEEDIEDEDEDEDGNKKPEFILMNVNQALDTSDCLIPAMFMKIFKYVFNIDTPAQDSHTAKEDPLQKDILKIDGISGAGKVDGEWTIHLKKGTDKTSVESKIRDIVGDEIKIIITEITDNNNNKNEKE